MNPLLAAVKNSFRQKAFIVAFVVLGVFGVTLNTVIAKLKLKIGPREAVPLRVASLKQGVPTTLGKWVLVSTDQAIDPETEQVLGTPQYIFRDYVNSQKVGAAEIKELKDAPANTREIMLGQLQTAKPSAVIRLGLTYYTGLVDTVAHIPERCYVADGFEVKQYKPVKAALGNYPDGKPRDIEFRFLEFEDQTAMGGARERVARNVGYLFQCNGEYTPDSFVVRRRLQNLFERYGYYAKVELMTAAKINVNYHEGAIKPIDADDSEAAMIDFLSEALPEIEKCLPDWNALHKK